MGLHSVICGGLRAQPELVGAGAKDGKTHILWALLEGAEGISLRRR